MHMVTIKSGLIFPPPIAVYKNVLRFLFIFIALTFSDKKKNLFNTIMRSKFFN